jgi:hypothetical protein
MFRIARHQVCAGNCTPQNGALDLKFIFARQFHNMLLAGKSVEASEVKCLIGYS